MLERTTKLQAFLVLETGEEKPDVPGIPKEVAKYALGTVDAQPKKNNKRIVSEDW